MKKSKETPVEAIIGLIVNLFLPGLGTIIASTQNKNLKNTGIIQLVLAIISVPLCLILVGFVLGFAVWLWALITGIKELTKNE